MGLSNILVFIALNLGFGLVFVWARGTQAPRAHTLVRPYVILIDRAHTRVRPYVQAARGWVMLVASLIAVYWLQSSTPIRYLDFWLPTASLGLTLIVWAAVSDIPRTFRPTAANSTPAPGAKASAPMQVIDVRDTWITLAVMAGVVLVIALLRYVDPLCCITPSRPPDLVIVVPGLLIIGALAVGAQLLFARRTGWLWLAVIIILALFVVLKLDVLGQTVSAGLRALNGQAASQASPLDLRWLGFSYIAFRLIHVLRDRATGKLTSTGKNATALSLREFVSYVVFFPSLTAGPIDRVDRFIKDYRNPALPQSADILDGGRRIIIGVFKKFVIADTLAIIALNSVNALQTNSTGWMWLVVYAYALRIFFDFSGYTDIALGLGRCFGIRLPENFDRPYLKPNLTLFWNSWHMTLAQWFRAYFFNPVTRALRSPKETPWLPAMGFYRSPTFIILFGQVSTMLLIGLWHGITWNFIAWGAWHAAGLFIHNRWADYTNRRKAKQENDQILPQAAGGLPLRLAGAVNVLITFHFVTLGWVWFALPDMGSSLAVFRKLFGVLG